jgi:hypothetical protein
MAAWCWCAHTAGEGWATATADARRPGAYVGGRRGATIRSG